MIWGCRETDPDNCVWCECGDDCLRRELLEEAEEADYQRTMDEHRRDYYESLGV